MSESADTAQGTSPIPDHFYFVVFAGREDGAFKAWKTKADIDRLIANIGQDILTLAHEDYGRQPVGKSKQIGLTLVTPNRTTCLTIKRYRSTLRIRRTGTMIGKLILLLPHYYNLNLRLINQQILDSLVTYPLPNECEWNQPGDLIDTQAKYEPLPTPPDS